MATIDTSIYGRLGKGADLSNLASGFSAGQQIREQRNKNRLQEMAMAKQDALNEESKHSYDPETGRLDQNKLFRGMASRGMGSAIPELQKSLADTQKAQADAALAEEKRLRSIVTWSRQELTAATDPDDARRRISMGVQLGMVPQEHAEAEISSIPNDPQGFAQWKQTTEQSLLTVEQRLNETYRRDKLVSDEHNAAANRAVTMRGQNMVDARARDQRSGPTGAPIEVTGPDGNPVLVQRYNDGSLRPVEGFSPKAREGMSITTNPDGTVSVTTGGGKAQKLTEQQSKDLVYLTRGEAASPILDLLGSNLADPSQRAAGALPLAGNFMVTPDFQRADQAGREFLAAVLRKDTGAAITNQEFDIYGKMYLPQPGDSDAVLTQKTQARRIALDAIRSGLGSAAEGAPPRSIAQPPSNNSLPTISTDSEYDSLPSGAEFLDPSGQTRRKP